MMDSEIEVILNTITYDIKDLQRQIHTRQIHTLAKMDLIWNAIDDLRQAVRELQQPLKDLEYRMGTLERAAAVMIGNTWEG